jgi:Uma2 family endonuclease
MNSGGIMATEPAAHRFSVDEYHRMIEAGILTEDDRMELIDGELIEVADTSIGFDRTRKLPMYAAAGIPEAWLIDLQSETIERHTHPEKGRYRLVMRATRGQSIESVALPGLVLDADVVLSR